MAANMKSAINFRFSPLLFKNKDYVSPIRFFCTNANDDLKSLIMKGGGYTVDKAEDADILLCEKRTDSKIIDGYLPYDFIVDCVMKDTLLSVDKYRENVLGLRASSSKDYPKSTDSNADLDLGPTESSRVSISKENLMGRKKYTYAEDLNIIKYLVTNDLCTQTGGNVVWKKMESFKVTPHTFQSMKSRFKLIMSRVHTYNIPDDWIAKLEESRQTESKDGHSSDKKDNQKFKSSTNDRGYIGEPEDSIELFTADISPIRNLERVNDSLSSESDSSVVIVIVPCPHNQNNLSMPDGHGSGSPGQFIQQNDSTPSECGTPILKTHHHKVNLNHSSSSECNTPAKRPPRHRINQNNPSTPECHTSTRRSTRLKGHPLESSSSLESIPPELTTTRLKPSKDQTKLSGAGSSGPNTPKGKKQLNDSSSADQSNTSCELHLNCPGSCSTLRLSCAKNQSDSEDQDSDHRSSVVGFINEGIMPHPSETPREGCNCENGESDRIIERKVKFLTKNLHVETLEALFLLKAFNGSLRKIMEYLKCKK